MRIHQTPRFRRSQAGLGLAWLLASACGADPSTDPSEQLFDLTFLHEISIQVDSQHLTQLDDKENEIRVPCDIVFDGVSLPRSGIRKKGSAGSLATIANKAAYSIKFDEFVPDQEIFGIDRILLNNARQDASFLNEHLGYEIARRSGLPAARTAYASVTLNGTSYGVYVIKEALDQDFLKRNFGSKFDQGNLYETPFLVDFVANPGQMDLKDEVEESRVRDDMNALVAAIQKPMDAQWATNVGKLIDLPAFLTHFALETVLSHWDGYAFNVNNYYMYNDPGRGKFVMLPHGMDQIWKPGQNVTLPPPWMTEGMPRPLEGLFAMRVLANPTLAAQYRAEIERIARDVYDLNMLEARIDRVTKLLHETEIDDERTKADIAKYDQNLEAKKEAIETRRTQLWPPPS